MNIMVEITGNILYVTKGLIVEKYGQEKFNEILEKLPDEPKALFSGIITSGEKYNMDYYDNLLDAIDSVLGKDELKRISVYQAEKQLSGFFGFFVKFVSVEKVLQRAESMWVKVNSVGKLEVTEFEDDHITVKISDFIFTDNHLLSSAYYFKGLIEIVTKKKVDASFKRIDGKTSEYLYTYS